MQSGLKLSEGSGRVSDMNDELAPVQRWYVDELNHLGEHGKAARYKVDVFSFAAAKRAIIEIQLGGDVDKVFDAETPKRVKDEWNEIGKQQAKLLMEAVTAKSNIEGIAGPDEEEELPEFIKEAKRNESKRNEAIDLTRKAMKLMSSGWYQNSSGELYHYDGVVWDNVPNGKIDDLEFLGG